MSAAIQNRVSVSSLALRATLHCLTGCGLGEIAGMVIGTALNWGNGATMALAITLAFVLGYSFTLVPLLKAGIALGSALRLALAADTASIVSMEIVDNLFMLLVPGAMDATLSSPLFWGSLTVAIVLGAAAAYPVNYWLIRRGGGHAVVHGSHHGGHAHGGAARSEGEPESGRRPEESGHRHLSHTGHDGGAHHLK